MAFGFASYSAGLLAGVLSTLSPCVLPIIPILLGSAANAHPRAPLALSAGLALSYAIIGTALAWAGSALGLRSYMAHAVLSVLLGTGAVLVVGLVGRALEEVACITADAVADVDHHMHAIGDDADERVGAGHELAITV